MIMKNLTSALCVGVLLCGSGLTLAQDGPHDDAIKARQALMQLQNFEVGILFDMAKEKIDYNADVAAEAAANLNATATYGQSLFWPAGSDNATDGNARTRALPAIWETYPAITEKAGDLKTAVAALVPVAGNGLSALQDAIGDVGGACKACHDDFRAERK